MKKFCGIGLRRSKLTGKIKDTAHLRPLDVEYFWLVNEPENMDLMLGEVSEGVTILTEEKIDRQIEALKRGEQSPFVERFSSILYRFKNIKKTLDEKQNQDSYHDFDLVYYYLKDGNTPITEVEDAYFRLQLISHRLVQPHEVSLDGLFGTLENIVWTNYGPILPEDIEIEKIKRVGDTIPLHVTHVDKFPYMVNYHIPSGVRIADGSSVRLGAYLGEGCTVMPAGYVNFNGGAHGPSMIEGRISSGVIVEEHSDIGGGGSIMGTLSGGNKHVITIGAKCLVGANAGTGISLGFGCTIAAGTYITAGSKISLYNKEKKPVSIEGKEVEDGQNIVKGAELSNKAHLLFIQDSVDGKLKCYPNPKTIQLNKTLHKFN